MEDLDLNSVASASMTNPSTTSETTSETSEGVEIPQKEETEEVKSSNQSPAKVEKVTEQPKLSRRQIAEKEASEYRTKVEKERLQWQREKADYLSQLNQLKEFEPLRPLIPEIKKALEAKKAQEDAEKYKQNPQGVTNSLIQQEIQKALQPFQQQILETKQVEFTKSSIESLKSFAGSEEQFNEIVPTIRTILDNVINTDPIAANKLAENPEFLFRVSRDIYNEQKGVAEKQQQEQIQIQNEKSKAEAAKFNGGISKPNRFAKAPVTQGREAAKTNAFNFIKEITGGSR